MVARLSLVALAFLDGAAADLQPERDAFHSFMREHDREYELGSHEYHHRLALYLRRAEEAEAHNAQPDRLWTAGVNHLSDRTEAELAQLRGWRGAAADPGVAQPPGSVSFLRRSGRSLPEEFMNWSSLASSARIRKQGGCGSCWAIAAATVLEQHSEIHNPQAERTFSSQELVTCVPNPHHCGGRGGCSGSTVELALHWAQTQGLAREEENVYSPRKGDDGCKRKLQAGLLQAEGDLDFGAEELSRPGAHAAPPGAPGLAFGMIGWERLPENGYEPLLRAVVDRGPVAVSVGAGGWAMYRHGVFNGCKKNAVIDHAVVLVGYGKDRKNGALFYDIQNSWGQSWGERGHIRLLRREGDAEECGVDKQPEKGTGCRGGPKTVKVCGMCGILYDSAVPHFEKLAA